MVFLSLRCDLCLIFHPFFMKLCKWLDLNFYDTNMMPFESVAALLSTARAVGARSAEK